MQKQCRSNRYCKAARQKDKERSPARGGGFEATGCANGGGRRARAAPRSKFLCDNSGSEDEDKICVVNTYEKVHKIIALQDFEGWWEYSAALNVIFGREIGVAGQRSRVWITMFVVRWLEKQASGDRDVWELVVGKARAWLDAHGTAQSMRELEKEIDEYILVID